jgi:hypothetical protein
VKQTTFLQEVEDRRKRDRAAFEQLNAQIEELQAEAVVLQEWSLGYNRPLKLAHPLSSGPIDDTQLRSLQVASL